MDRRKVDELFTEYLTATRWVVAFRKHLVRYDEMFGHEGRNSIPREHMATLLAKNEARRTSALQQIEGLVEEDLVLSDARVAAEMESYTEEAPMDFLDHLAVEDVFPDLDAIAFCKKNAIESYVLTLVALAQKHLQPATPMELALEMNPETGEQFIQLHVPVSGTVEEALKGENALIEEEIKLIPWPERDKSGIALIFPD
ncbi:MAG: hypothetical protein HY007_04475 [Candidatus Sungbacteria bacterium]|nr:hypothetical protein [Candidatus Sungbacteria bacterium]